VTDDSSDGSRKYNGKTMTEINGSELSKKKKEEKIFLKSPEN